MSSMYFAVSQEFWLDDRPARMVLSLTGDKDGSLSFEGQLLDATPGLLEPELLNSWENLSDVPFEYVSDFFVEHLFELSMSFVVNSSETLAGVMGWPLKVSHVDGAGA